LFEEILKRRAQIGKERQIRGDNIPETPEIESLPRGWASSALGQITIVTDPNPSHRYPDYTNGTVPILSTQEFNGLDEWQISTAKLTTEEFWRFQVEHCAFADGDIVFARKGRLGLPRFLPRTEKFTFSHTIFIIKPMPGILPYYLLWLLRRDETIDWLTNEMNQNTGVPTLGKAKTERLPVPLPPLAEQHRIVAKVDQLMALCDRLEASLTASAITRRHLLDALLAEALAPASTEQREAAE
jgi:type I restriction enzyme, S subunit